MKETEQFNGSKLLAIMSHAIIEWVFYFYVSHSRNIFKYRLFVIIERGGKGLLGEEQESLAARLKYFKGESLQFVCLH